MDNDSHSAARSAPKTLRSLPRLFTVALATLITAAGHTRSARKSMRRFVRHLLTRSGPSCPFNAADRPRTNAGADACLLVDSAALRHVPHCKACGRLGSRPSAPMLPITSLIAAWAPPGVLETIRCEAYVEAIMFMSTFFPLI